MGETKKSLDTNKLALMIYLDLFGEEHIGVAMSYYNLGTNHEKMEDSKQALDYYQKALTILLKKLS